MTPTKRKQKDYVDLSIGLIPMRYDKNKDQVKHDTNVVLERDYDWFVMTELTGRNLLARTIPGLVKEAGYRVHKPLHNDTLVAVNERIIDGEYREDFVPVLSSKQGVGPHGDRGITLCSWHNDKVGPLTVGGAHMLTRGRTKDEPNFQLNELFCRNIHACARKFGRGRGLFFFEADTNRIDSKSKDALGDIPLSSAADETGHWEGTGHGAIDGFYKYDRDGRVEFVSTDVKTDKEVFLHTDHYLSEAKVRIKIL